MHEHVFLDLAILDAISPATVLYFCSLSTMDTDSKVSTLSGLFPQVEKDVILEMLILNDGSLKRTQTFLTNQVGKPMKSMKRERDEDEEGENARPRYISKHTALYQSSLVQLFKTKDKKPGSTVRHSPINQPKSLTLYTKDDIESSIPYVKFYKNFLPADVADNILKELLERQSAFKNKEFYIAGNKCQSNHKSALFFSNVDVNSKGYDEGFYSSVLENEYSDYMRIVEFLIEDKMESLDSERTKHPFEINTRWKGDLCVGNLFEANSNNLDWHSDKLSHIGPLPTVCSISLGATRDFRLRKIHPATGNTNPIINIPLPHNTLVVMGPGCQEEYKHCIPPMTNKGLDEHYLSGSKRFNLTFRMYHPCLNRSIPNCPRCESSMILRRMFKDVQNRGKYFWSCSGSYKNAECKGYYWANFKEFENYDYEADEDQELILYTKEEDEASEWIADDDIERHEYLMRMKK